MFDFLAGWGSPNNIRSVQRQYMINDEMNLIEKSGLAAFLMRHTPFQKNCSNLINELNSGRLYGEYPQPGNTTREANFLKPKLVDLLIFTKAFDIPLDQFTAIWKRILFITL